MSPENSQNTFLYDDDSFFTFNHHEMSNLAAVQTLDEMYDPERLSMWEELEKEFARRSEETKE